MEYNSTDLLLSRLNDFWGETWKKIALFVFILQIGFVFWEYIRTGEKFSNRWESTRNQEQYNFALTAVKAHSITLPSSVQGCFQETKVHSSGIINDEPISKYLYGSIRSFRMNNSICKFQAEFKPRSIWICSQSTCISVHCMILQRWTRRKQLSVLYLRENVLWNYCITAGSCVSVHVVRN